MLLDFLASRPSSGVARSVQQNPSTSSANSVESIFQHFLSNPEELASLQQRNPELAEAIMSGDYNWTMQALSQYRQRIMVSYKVTMYIFVNICCLVLAGNFCG